MEEIEKCILKFEHENKIDFHVYKYYSGEVLAYSNLSFDVVFLDIIMDKMNGIDTGKTIKSKDIRTQVVYITNFADYSMRAHEVHAFDFIEKPINYNRMEQMLSDLIKYIMSIKEIKNSSEFIRVIKDDSSEILINTDDIRFFEYSSSRKIIMYITDNTYDNGIIIRDTIYNLYEKLDTDDFYMPHRAYIVNLNYVKSIDTKNKIILMTNEKTVYLSQKKQKEFKEKLHKYIRSKGILI